jgi:hydroxyethylthiazole kinase-like uncharacterized protein yjeF
LATSNNRSFRSYLHQRSDTGDKYTSGRLLIDAGSSQFPGAAVLTVGGARRGGAGYINYLSREPLPTELVLRSYPDVVPLSDIGTHEFDAIVVGPGGPDISSLPTDKRVIIDGGALAYVTSPAPAGRIWILTPHEGEARRMGFEPSNRESCALKAAQELRAVVLLKGRHSIVATPDGISFTDKRAGTELSTAGTGDVLAGLIGSMISAHRPNMLREAAEVVAHSVEIFAAAAYSSMRRRAPLVATDVMEEIPRLLAQEGTSL